MQTDNLKAYMHEKMYCKFEKASLFKCLVKGQKSNLLLANLLHIPVLR